MQYLTICSQATLQRNGRCHKCVAQHFNMRPECRGHPRRPLGIIAAGHLLNSQAGYAGAQLRLSPNLRAKNILHSWRSTSVDFFSQCGSFVAVVLLPRNKAGQPARKTRQKEALEHAMAWTQEAHRRLSTHHVFRSLVTPPCGIRHLSGLALLYVGTK